jgi:hypothetical protein
MTFVDISPGMLLLFSLSQTFHSNKSKIFTGGYLITGHKVFTGMNFALCKGYREKGKLLPINPSFWRRKDECEKDDRDMVFL